MRSLFAFRGIGARARWSRFVKGGLGAIDGPWELLVEGVVTHVDRLDTVLVNHQNVSITNVIKDGQRG